ncbi:PilN domain-containing protein [Cobetia amphilecti]|jgi:type IV pilus assembly protein PilN|uniref:PilN domain-containing protein n=2 Tax=Cobetia TaxID=204286 RepID=A0ABT6UPZ0_9GAMM|nr:MULTISPECIES: PilN domain-containing protein [Cobetia]AVV34478.1 fimbrial assembly protein [Halomonas sp. SF2003]MBR9755544.1 fimbrial assembly protein [Gammaproteobacteria bacterium]TCJ27216.1 fimbrial assembly protein [Halomonas sp. GDM18]MBE2169693.1 PilN domain-containing protein [Cobetia sp. 2AS1]MBS4152775.1 PilN domain-containing protein [Cobetia sp. MC34]|tara:strand:- start:1027 stop:1617 length:591 start_codon:yes stop_codon:yes gene_type:complete
MTIEINLLSWREDRREKRSKRFMGILALAAVIGIGGGYGMSEYYQSQLEAQQQRHAFIEKEMARLNRDIKEVEDIEARRTQMLDQIELIRSLQFSRPETVRVFNQLVTSLVDGAWYQSISRSGRQLKANGTAESTRQVSGLMRAIALSDSFGTPTLSDVQSNDDDQRSFNIMIPERPTGSALSAADAENDKKGGRR